MSDASKPDWPPRPRWQPPITSDLERIARTCAYYLDNRDSFAVFERGTCALMRPGIPKPLENTVSILREIIHHHPDFRCQRMDDGNWMITYKYPAMNIVFGDEFESNIDYIEAHYRSGIIEDEVFRDRDGAVAPLDKPSDKIGLLGRARMFMDALNPKIIGVWSIEAGKLIQPTPDTGVGDSR